MLGKKMGSFKKLAKKVVKVKNIGKNSDDQESKNCQESLLIRQIEDQEETTNIDDQKQTPNGFFAVYVGEERERFVVPTSYLNHPLLKMLLEKSYNEFGFAQQINKLVVPCNVSTFQEVVNAVECSNGRFDFGDLVEEFI